MGDTANTREPGRRVGLDRHTARRQADAQGGGGGAPRAGRHGGQALGVRPIELMVVTASSAPRRSRQARQLRGADRRPNTSTSSSTGTRSTATRSMPPEGAAQARSEHKIVGQPINARTSRRKCSRRKTRHRHQSSGMVHADGPAAHCGPGAVKVDEASIKDIPGAQGVWEKGFLAVVADKKGDAIRAAAER